MEGDDKVITDKEEAYKRIVKILNEKFGGIKMKKKLVLSLAAAALVGTLAVGGTLAWFTDTETATNVVTTGNVEYCMV